MLGTEDTYRFIVKKHGASLKQIAAAFRVDQEEARTALQCLIDDGRVKHGGWNGRGKRLYEPAPEPPLRRVLPPGECAYCDSHRDDSMMPPHDASRGCESGRRDHCTCDTCY